MHCGDVRGGSMHCGDVRGGSMYCNGLFSQLSIFGHASCCWPMVLHYS